MKKVLFICLIALEMIFTSCNRLPDYNLYDSAIEFNDGCNFYKITQTLNENEGLGKGFFCNADVVYIISDTPLYDGMIIEETSSMKFKMLGTCRYYTKGKEWKVIPIIKLLDVNNTN